MPAMMRERVAAYREARARAQRTTTARLHHDEARARAASAVDGLDQVGLARLTAIRDELQSRGELVPPLDAVPT